MITPNFKIKADKETADYGMFIIEPLQQGYGNTLGNALRRVLLSSMAGSAIVSVRINGVKHLFTTLKGLKEDIVELTLNLKQVRIANQSDKPIKITIDKTGPGKVTAGDLECPAGVKITNPELVLGHLADKTARLKGEFMVESGYGYVPVEEREVSNEIGLLQLDAIFTPIKRVNYLVSATRVGRVTNYDKLTMEIWTDGSISPRESLMMSAKTLSSFFEQVYEPKEISEEVKDAKPMKDEVLTLTVEELELPTRIVNSLLRAGIKDVGDLKSAGRKKLSKIKNLGGKSLKVVEAAASEKGIVIED